MKRAAALCAISILALSSALPVRAADKGGLKDGMGDLEERVAELEAITAHKGNRKVTVTISGQINKAMLWTDGLGPKQNGVIDNSSSPSTLNIEGVAKIDKDWRAGYRVEFGLDNTPAIPLLENQVNIRHNFVWLEGPVGKLSLGHTSMASDKTTSVTLANTDVASRMLSLAPLSTVYFLGFDLPWNDVRRDLVRYDSPVFGGFILSASYANGDTAAASIINSGFNPDHAWDVALRFAQEIKEGGGWRIAAAVGYRDENYTINASPISFLPFVRDKVYSGSASVMQMSTGLFVNVAGAKVQGELLFGGMDYQAYQVQAGMERKFFAVGKTTLYGEYAQMQIDSVSSKPWFIGGGVIQSIDAAALDLYATVKQIDLDDGSPKASQFLAGARIKF